MKLRKKTKDAASAHRELFISTARKYIGYLAEPALHRNAFGAKVGYDSNPWSGAFIDVIAREAGLQLPSFTYTPAALAECFRTGSISLRPEPGDIVVFNFSSNVGAASNFSAPHCGIVTDVREFFKTGRFATIEGNTTGTTSYEKKDGVYQKLRHATEVLAFCRPAFTGGARSGERRLTFNERLARVLYRSSSRITSDEADMLSEAARSPKVLHINGEIKHGDRNKKIETLQLALSLVTDLRDVTPGKWDAATSAACARFQRNIGRVGDDVTGLPDLGTLQRLAKETGVFSIE